MFNLIPKRFRSQKTLGHPSTAEYWVNKWLGHGGSVTEESSLKLNAVWAAVNVISGAVGMLPLVTYKRIDDRSKQRAFNHPTYRLLHDRANPYMSANVLQETLQGHALLWGNGYAEIELNGAGRPVALWPLPPSAVTPEFDGNVLVYKVNTDKGEVVLPSNQMYHVHGLGSDGIKGYSVIKFAGDNISLGMAAENNASAFFKNDSSPSGILTHPGVLEKPTKDKVKEDWERQHRGSQAGLSRRYRIAVLHSGMDWKQIGIPAKDAQLIESRQFSVNDIARWFQIPPHMIGDLARATFSNIEQQSQEFVTLTLMKWLVRWQDEANYKLFKSSERSRFFTEYVTQALLRGDTKARFEAYTMGRLGTGHLSVNDIRAMENMNPVEGGDGYLQPLNMTELGSAPDNDDVRSLLESTCKRVVSKEVRAIRKAIKKPDSFRGWLEEFYKKHLDYVDSVVSPILKLSGSRAESELYCNERRNLVEIAFEAGTTNELLESWEDDGHLLVASTIIKESLWNKN